MEYAKLNEDGSVSKAENYEEADRNRIIKQEHYKKFFISTVFLPIDHSFGNSGPVHFETYVFNSDGEKVTDYCELWGERSKTKEDALRIHDNAKTLIDEGSIINGS